MIKGLISVIVPVYKTEAFLTKCVESIRAQTYENLEMILVDDGSPDNSGNLCDRLAKEDERISVIHKPNGGLASARNTGLDAAKGEYVAFVDSDDTIDADMFGRMQKQLEEENADICMCGLNMIYDGYERVVSFPNEWTLSPAELWDSYISDFRTYHMLIACSCNKLLRRGVLHRNNAGPEIRFPEDVRMAEDGYFVADCIEATQQSIIFMDFAPYNYSQINNPVSITKVESYKLVDDLLDYMKEAMHRALPQRIAEIEKVISFQKHVNTVIAVHIAVTNRIKPPFRLRWPTVATVLRGSTSREERFSALIMYFLPPPLYRAAFMLYCRLSKSQ